jgi:hypothetical protein
MARAESCGTPGTNPGRRFTPHGGWPNVEFAGGTPPSLMDPSVADYLVPERLALGELRLEILETDDLPKMDLFLDENDVWIAPALPWRRRPRPCAPTP